MAVLFSREMLALIEQVGRVRSPVLVLGETGTGKEVVARAIHEVERQGAFVTIDCGAITGTLMESEMFGHVRGAFTGADRNKRGLIAEAHNGTAFFDEIGDLALDLQVKLLRVLQEKRYRPVGSTRYEDSEFRVIAATHRDLPQWIEQGRFREDLYYRLNVIRILIPPLRDRPEELPALVDHLLEKFAHGAPPMLSSATMRALFHYRWPGNVRELSNVIERAVALGDGALLCLGDLPETVAYGEAFHSAQSFARWDQAGAGVVAGTLAEAEKRHILATLARYSGDRTQTADVLGISRTTLFRKLREYGV
jgi:transcriptional regulator with PAS, ATPase and Fis domain